MSFCVNCGLEYDAKLGNNFCAKCGFNFRKNTPQKQEASENTATVNQLPVSQPVKKPLAGIIVALVVGVFGLIWNSTVLFHNIYGNPSNVEALLYQTFPSLQIKIYIGLSFAMLGNTVLIIGGLMAHLNHPTGAKVVRITSYSMIGLSFVLTTITFFVVTGSETWPTLGASTKGTLIGGLVGGIIGALLQCGLLIFLFRDQVKSKTKLTPSILTTIPKPIDKKLHLKCGTKIDVSLGQTICSRCGAELPEILTPTPPILPTENPDVADGKPGFFPVKKIY